MHACIIVCERSYSARNRHLLLLNVKQVTGITHAQDSVALSGRAQCSVRLLNDIACVVVIIRLVRHSIVTCYPTHDALISARSHTRLTGAPRQTRVCRRSQSTPVDLCLPVYPPTSESVGPRVAVVLVQDATWITDHDSTCNLRPPPRRNLHGISLGPFPVQGRPCPQRSDLILLRGEVYDGQFDCENWPYSVARTDNNKRCLHSRRQVATCTFS